LQRGRRLVAYLVGGLALVLAGVLLGAVLSHPGTLQAQPSAPGTQRVSEPASIAFPGGSPSAIADVAERLSPAVVYIEVRMPRATQRPSYPDPFWWPFFGPQFPPRSGETVQAGTGFIIDQEGHILTNQHVVGSLNAGQSIRVYLQTPEFTDWVDAELIGADYQLDLAVLKIEKPRELKELPVAPLGDSDTMRPGDWVIAIGKSLRSPAGSGAHGDRRGGERAGPPDLGLGRVPPVAPHLPGPDADRRGHQSGEQRRSLDQHLR